VNLLRFVQHTAAALIVNFSGFGQADTAGTPVKKLYLKVIFQSGDGLADRRDAHL
jgi:hypothetical protein